VIVPHAAEIEYPVLLEFAAPKLLAYSRETVVAEKLEAITVLGLLNSRMKDYFDLMPLSRLYEFDGTLLLRTVQANFKRRSTEILRRCRSACCPNFRRHPENRHNGKRFCDEAGLKPNARMSMR
jgi:hypothetical protein